MAKKRQVNPVVINHHDIHNIQPGYGLSLSIIDQVICLTVYPGTGTRFGGRSDWNLTPDNARSWR
jgi:hypothetical protein